MRLLAVTISGYKNLKNFSIDFNEDKFLEVILGQNGAGKSNLIEALIDIFRHIYEVEIKKSRQSVLPNFSYQIRYEIDGNVVDYRYADFLPSSTIAHASGERGFPFPDNVIVYYSGQNEHVAKILDRYESNFKRTIDKADDTDSRVFIGIGPEYKNLLLAVLILLPVNNRTSRYVFSKIGILGARQSLQLTLNRPNKEYAKGVEIEAFDPTTHYWGLRGGPLRFVKRLEQCIKGEFQHHDIYDANAKNYVLRIDVELFHHEFAQEDAATVFRLFDNLKTLDMIVDISADLELSNGEIGEISHFSDGQFQSIYIYAITEIFKDRNCITLLDEPDSFLHPHWQLEFLSQLTAISAEHIKKNHVMMTSHSVATISQYPYAQLKTLVNRGEAGVQAQLMSKKDAVKELAGNKILLDESEAAMSITTFLQSTDSPVLFTEGVTDEHILTIAWEKLYPDVAMPFCIQNAFDCKFLRNLFSRDEIRHGYPERVMFALFDFDEAYGDWKGLGIKEHIETDPHKGLIKQLRHETHYAMLLPVPENESIKQQVLQDDGTPWKNPSDCHLSIELLFYGEETLEDYFKTERKSGGGSIVQFKANNRKVEFAEDHVPALPASSFEIFRPLFDFIKSQCV